MLNRAWVLVALILISASNSFATGACSDLFRQTALQNSASHIEEGLQVLRVIRKKAIVDERLELRQMTDFTYEFLSLLQGFYVRAQKSKKAHLELGNQMAFLAQLAETQVKTSPLFSPERSYYQAMRVVAQHLSTLGYDGFKDKSTEQAIAHIKRVSFESQSLFGPKQDLYLQSVETQSQRINAIITEIMNRILSMNQ